MCSRCYIYVYSILINIEIEYFCRHSLNVFDMRFYLTVSTLVYTRAYNLFTILLLACWHTILPPHEKSVACYWRSARVYTRHTLIVTLKF